jgi:hypothetical protein
VLVVDFGFGASSCYGWFEQVKKKQCNGRNFGPRRRIRALFGFVGNSAECAHCRRDVRRPLSGQNLLSEHGAILLVYRHFGGTSYWPKIILIIFSPITKLFRLRSLLLSPFLCRQRHVRTSSSVMQITADSGREKKAIDAQQSMSCDATPPRSCPCVLVLCRRCLSSLQRRSLLTRHGHPAFLIY